MSNTKEKAPIYWHFTCQFSIQSTSWRFENSYDENDIKEEMNDLVRLHKAMQK